MRQFKTYIILAIISILISACGGGGESSSGGGLNPNNTNNSTTVMTIGEIYTMRSGQSIVKKSDDAQVLLKTDIKTGITTAILQQGKAVIE